MSAKALHHLEGMLPWDDLPSDKERRQRITFLMIALAIIVSLLVFFIKVPAQPRAESEALPERMARVVERKVELPPPPPPPPKEEIKKEEKKPEEPVASPKETPKPAEVAKARENAKKLLESSGVSNLAKEFEDLGLPTSAGSLITNTQEAGTSRNLITSKAGSGSGAGSAYTGSVSTGYGGKAGGKGSSGVLGGGTLQAVQTGIGAAGAGGGRAPGKDGKLRRSAEDIRKTFDQYGARLNSAYQRALRDDPTLQGTVRVKLTVEPDGSVSSVSVVSSQLNNPDLEAKIVTIVKTFNFGADNVETWSGSHDINLFPN